MYLMSARLGISIHDWVLLCNFLFNSTGLTSFLLNVTPDAKVKAQPLKEWHTAQQDGGKVRKLNSFRFRWSYIACELFHLIFIFSLFSVAIPNSILICTWRLF